MLKQGFLPKILAFPTSLSNWKVLGAKAPTLGPNLDPRVARLPKTTQGHLFTPTPTLDQVIDPQPTLGRNLTWGQLLLDPTKVPTVAAVVVAYCWAVKASTYNTREATIPRYTTINHASHREACSYR